ncbi:unannotated protein [freshwater metagenome]|uniref:Unannotated protein n=1 Tax=freshwater metagenome TaxID=449393 RepID=A0A6J7QV99_9ZZZZ
MRPLEVTCPDARGEAVFGRIHALDGILVGAERLEHGHGAEHLLVRDARGARAVFKQRRALEEAANKVLGKIEGFVTRDALNAILTGALQVRPHHRELASRDHGAELRGRILRITDPDQ